MVYDVSIIGAGVAGSLIARELSKYRLKICLIDKASDVAAGSSKANSAIIHAGYDAEPGTLKALLNVRGNALMERLAGELGVSFKRTGSILVAFSEDGMETVRHLYKRGLENGVPELDIIPGERVKELEPNISKDVVGALYAKTAGIICPYGLTAAAAENAVDNGAELLLEREVRGIKKEEGLFVLNTQKGEIRSRYVVNAAGVNADRIAGLIGERDFSVAPRKGEYLLLDKSQGKAVNNVIFQTPTKMGKGILVAPTVHGNLLLGPTSVDIEDREDVSTSSPGLRQVAEAVLKVVPSIDLKQVITSFAGLRATPSTGDFVIRPSKLARGFINAAGIESPGLTAAPAIAEYVTGILRAEGLELEPNESFNPVRRPPVRFDELGDEERGRLIKADPRYGRIVCRCEMVTEGEIVDCIKRPAGARNLDAVKRRTRAGMGRCQGGFCTPRLAEILSRELGIPMDEVTKKGGNSRLLAGKSK